jgi:DNA gyrase/topoisomerase IV subunit B
MSLTEIDGIPFAQMALTSLHQTPTLDRHAPHEHIASWGIGLCPVCALSQWLEYRVTHQGRFISQRFEHGVAVSGLRDEGPSNSTGTRIVFAPDPTIFPSFFDSGPILARLREMSYCLPKLTFHFADRREYVLHEPRGIVAHVDSVASRWPNAMERPAFVVSGEVRKIAVEVAARWTPGDGPRIESFANIHRMSQGGTHTRGLILGFVEGFRQAAPRACAHHSANRLERVVSRGLIATVCVRLNDPTYESPTRGRLATPAAKYAVKKCVAPAFRVFLESNPPLLAELLSERK